MNAIRKVHARTVRLFALIATFAAALAIPAQSAFAQVAPPEVPIAGGRVGVTPAVIHTSSSAGPAVWIVVVIAIAAIAVGAGLRELVHGVSRLRARRPVTV
jgi:hypothetical protein